MWQDSKDLQDNFNNLQMALKMLFERITDPAYHSSGMGRIRFGMDKALAILQRLHTLYVKPSLGELDSALLCLHDPMDRNKPAEVMIQAIEEVQLFLLSHLEDNISLPDTELINSAIIKINKTGIYPKELARWNTKAATDHNVWSNFRNHMIAECEKFLAEGRGTTLSQ